MTETAGSRGDAAGEFAFEGPLDLRGTLAPLAAGRGDPTFRVSPRGLLRATRTPVGPASLLVERTGEGRLRARAWGPGAERAVERVPDLLGLDETPPLLDGPPVLRDLARRAQGVRLPRTHAVVELLVPIVLQQLVSGKEASRAFVELVRAFSQPAPGPVDGLMLPLGPEELRALPSWAFPPLGVPPRHGEVLRRLGWHARRLEEADAMAPPAAERRMRALRGIGIWSARSALLRGMGAPDAVPVGDYNLPRTVAYTLAGEERSDDARMLELLAPFRGQRGRVVRWIHAAGRTPPRRGPRRPLRPLPPERREALRALAPRR